MGYSVGILTVSDTAARQGAADLTGPALRRHPLLQGPAFELARHGVVPDDAAEIQKTLLEWTDELHVDLLLTSGGTGCGPRDTTPETIGPLLHRQAPGLVHLMLASSLEITPFAALARPVAGMRFSSLIITLPGSPKAAGECVTALQNVLPHALELLAGRSGHAVHQSLGAPSTASRIGTSGHAAHEHHAHHHHHHRHHGPTPLSTAGLDTSARHRSSPYPLVDLDVAFASIFAECPTLEAQPVKVGNALLGRCLAQDVVAPCDLPQRPTSNVDGYAVRAPLSVGAFSVVTPSSHHIDKALPGDLLYRIVTGAPLPMGANSVCMVEDTQLEAANEDGEERSVRTLAAVPPGQHVRQPGSDVRAGNIVVGRGQVVSAAGGELGTLAFVGLREATVHRLPRVAILSTGDELVDIHADNVAAAGKSSWGGVFDCNRPAVASVLHSHHYPTVDCGIVRDTRAATATALRAAAAVSDVIITTGGTSMGESDFLKPVIEQELGGTIHFGRVAMKPGKPTTFASIPAAEGRKVMVFGLPGNPASGLVTLQVFVLPALRKMAGFPRSSWHLPAVAVKLAFECPVDPRPEFHRVTVYATAGEEGPLLALSTGGQRSSRTPSLVASNALLKLPSASSRASRPFAKGETVDALLVGPLLTEPALRERRAHALQ